MDDKNKNIDDDKMNDDKFILMGIDDAGEVADVLRSKTAKKILDYLADHKEASEKDMADGIGIPINTIEYNLKKLIKAGFIKKSKNFFWSVKGRKIEMYKLARKHIIISPNKTKPSISYLKTLLPVLLIAFAIVALVGLFTFLEQNYGGNDRDPGVITLIGEESKLKQFDSSEDLKDFLKENTESNSDSKGDFGINRMFAENADMAPQATGAVLEASGGGASDYSQTNIQVQGVDEADIMKNDGKYIYTVSGNNVIIVDAYPAEDMEVISEINFSNSISEIFINNDKLIIFSQGYQNVYATMEAESVTKDVACLGPNCGGYNRKSTNIIYIYDIRDRENPKLENKIETDGNYVNSRMIGDYVYVVNTKYVNNNNPEPPIYWSNGVERKVMPSQIYYWDYPDTSYSFTSIMAIDVEDGKFNKKVYLTGGTREIYVSQNNIFLTYQKKFNYGDHVKLFAEEVAFPLLPPEKDEEVKDILDSKDYDYAKSNKIKNLIYKYSLSLTGDEKEDFDSKLIDLTEDFDLIIQKKMEKTIIHKISIDKDEINYKCVGEVPGRILNQFSMDEYNGNFRIATTTGNWGQNSLNHIYVLDEDLEIIGKIEDLAKGERIFSARFMGKRAYLVTFEAIDPLFVIDLSNPEDPKVLGYLKIPGYSDYLHPYDENHVIGIGKDVDASIDADKIHSDYAVYYTAVLGVKISLFDVSDVENPIEKHKFVIGDRGTESPVLNDHKALLFDKEKNLLVLPMTVVEREEGDESYNGGVRWQGAYILNFNLDEISLRGRVSHDDSLYTPAKQDPIGTERTDVRGNLYIKTGEDNWEYKNSYRYDGQMNYTDSYIDNVFNRPDYKNAVKRSLFMDDVLYTISQNKVKANDLKDLYEISEVKLMNY